MCKSLRDTCMLMERLFFSLISSLKTLFNVFQSYPPHPLDPSRSMTPIPYLSFIKDLTSSLKERKKEKEQTVQFVLPINPWMCGLLLECGQPYQGPHP